MSSKTTRRRRPTRGLKALRHVQVDGQPLRRRFTVRDDSLWWFAELYLHKQRVILDTHRTIAALEALLSSERPQAIRLVSRTRPLAVVGPQAARARNVRWLGAPWQPPWWLRLAGADARARMLMLASRAAPVWRRTAGTPAGAPRAVAAFVHSAFWRRGATESTAEVYIGPVLNALDARDSTAVPVCGSWPAARTSGRKRRHRAGAPESLVRATLS